MTNGLNANAIQNIEEEEILISKLEAAELLKINTRTLERYQEQGRIIPRYINENGKRKVKYSLQEICDFGGVLLPDTPTSTNGGERVEPKYQEIDGVSLFVELASKFVGIYERSQSPLICYRELDEAVEKGWLLSTASVRKLIGVAPRGKEYSWANYVFKVEGKVKNGFGWKVYIK